MHSMRWLSWSLLVATTAGELRAPVPFADPPEAREDRCPRKYDLSQFANSTVSVILPWHKESWEHLSGTLGSLVKYTPDELIEEYLFISDGNEDPMEADLKAISSKVKVIALPEREGLIRAKMKGVEAATAPVIVFLEAHCIVNRQWLQPLLHRLLQKPKALIMPALDVIPQTDFKQYSKTMPIAWRYEWNLNLVTTNLGGQIPRDGVSPYISPGTSGGIFAMRRDWFLYLKLFDVGMLEWGGDHFELTMKVWRCGGRIETMPCSRIGHLFRDPAHRPYPVEVDQVVKNYKRLAHVWLKEHYSYFDRMKPEARQFKLGSMEQVEREFKELKCKNMQWYLENVDHEMLFEMDKICHPYVSGADKCKGQLAPGRFTITNKDVMSPTEYLRVKKASRERRKETRLQEAAARDGTEL